MHLAAPGLIRSNWLAAGHDPKGVIHALASPVDCECLMIAESGAGLWPVPDRPAPGSILNSLMQSFNWTAILLAIMVLLVLFRSGPGLRALLERSRQAQQRDWLGFLIPIALVVLFVLLLMKSI